MNGALRGMPVLLCFIVCATCAQADVNTAPSKATLEEASRASCEGVSVVVQRCVASPDRSAAQGPTDASTRSRATAKAAFDRRDNRARAAAMKGEIPEPTTAAGDAQRLGGVSVTGKADENILSPEAVLQRALAPAIVPSGPRLSRQGAAGTRYECYERCVGTHCCIEVRTTPNPALESNLIGR